jgi:putative hydrolase of the HAD superfamily
MAIRAVLFDMGGTIETLSYDRELRLKAVPGLRKILSGAGVSLPITDEQFLDLFTERFHKYHQWRKQSLQELPTWQIWMDYILCDYPEFAQQIKAISEALTVYYELNFYQRKMRPEMPAVLEAIRMRGLKIGVISNVCSLGQVPTNLDRYGLKRYFDLVVLSSEYGRRKPDPAIFHYAARLMAIPTSQCLYVGDLVSRDVIGARKAGYRIAVQIRHEFTQDESGDGAIPDAVIDDMAELLDVLEKECVEHATTITPGEIQAILFDAGDILYHRPHSGHKFKAFLKNLSLETHHSHTEEKKNLTTQAYRGQISQDQYWEAVVRMYGITDPGQIESGKQILAAEGDDVEPIDGVPETLAVLKKMGFLLGIVTDTATSISRKLEWFEKGGFGNVWDSIISSKEIGIRKPDPRIYQAALHQLGLNPEQAVFVGHDARELEGARTVGLRTIAFNYEKAAKADFYVERFSDLLKLPLIASALEKSAR